MDFIKDGQLIKISMRSWNDNSIHQENILPVLLSMYGDFSWILVYVKNKAFSEDFLSVNLSLDNLKVIDIHTITALSPYKNKYVYELDTSIDYAILNSVSFVEERKNQF